MSCVYIPTCCITNPAIRDILNYVGGDPDATGEDVKLSMFQIVKRSLGRFSMKRFGALFQDKKLGLTTLLLWFQWTTIGMAYPLFNAFLPQYLANSGGELSNSPSVVYRNCKNSSFRY
jgi:hypothetical protein